jgi:serine/threonine-protein kinase HipA
MLKELIAYIFLDGDGWVPCGTIEYDEQGRYSESRFRYGTRYLERPDAIAIDPVQLPLHSRTFVTTEGFALFNGIRDAGPDRWGRYLLDKKFARALSELEYVASTGPDRVGALAFSDSPTSGPKVYTPKGFAVPRERNFDLAKIAGAIADIEKSEDTERLKEYLQYGPSLGGARPKAQVVWDGKPYLAKFSLSRDHRNEPLVEYATMSLAKICGLNVPSIDKAEALERTVYLIERFDRREGIPIPFISGLTITGIHESDYQTWSYHLLVDALVKFSSNANRDLSELFRRMVYNILVYNNDDHLRNFGFLRSGKNYWELSPLYDVVPATVTAETYSLAMTIGTEGKKASLTNALSQCERFRLSREEAEGIVSHMREKVSGWKDHFKKCGVSDADIRAVENGFSQKP